jgi:hypothetical protein
MSIFDGLLTQQHRFGGEQIQFNAIGPIILNN